MRDQSACHSKLERIAMLGSMPPIRGLSSYCLEAAKAVAELVQVEFISFRNIYPIFLYPGKESCEDHSFPETTHPRLRIRRGLSWYNPMSWAIEGMFTGGRLLHAQWWSLPLAPIYLAVCLAFRLRGKPVVFTVHNVLPHEKSRWYRWFSLLLFQLGNHFIVHSLANREQLIRHYRIPAERISQIPHGPLEFQGEYEVDRGQVRKGLGYQPEDKVILLFGAVRPYKGIDTALKAFAEVLSKVPQARLLIAGKLWESWEPYQDLIDKLGIGSHVNTELRYIPSDEVARFFLASDLVVLPYSHFDAQSGVGATALFFHKPMIVTDVGGLPELLMDRHYVVPPGDANKLSEKICECLLVPAKLAQMAIEAKTMAEKISWPAVARKTYSVYEKVCGNGHIVGQETQ